MSSSPQGFNYPSPKTPRSESATLKTRKPLEDVDQLLGDLPDTQKAFLFVCWTQRAQYGLTKVYA